MKNQEEKFFLELIGEEIQCNACKIRSFMVNSFYPSGSLFHGDDRAGSVFDYFRRLRLLMHLLLLF